MALTREQVNALARHVIKTLHATQQPHQMSTLDTDLMEAYRRLDERLPSSTLGEGRLPAEANLAQSIGQLPDNEKSQAQQQNAPQS